MDEMCSCLLGKERKIALSIEDSSALIDEVKWSDVGLFFVLFACTLLWV